jgi:hypothetical protein
MVQRMSLAEHHEFPTGRVVVLVDVTAFLVDSLKPI